ncbi:MAG: AMP-binding protein [Acidimicrobiia bacterium]|nr:AMP-binding protein [Acidimicrobiia bacterium]
MTAWNFADVWETIASVQPDAPALVRGSSVRSWGEFDARSEAIAQGLFDAGLAHQSRVAQYLMNSMEYLESLFGTYKAAMVPVNTNYRYVADELAYLWLDAGVEAVMFHGSFTESTNEVRARVPNVKLWLWVDDGVGECPDWAVPYERVAASGAVLSAESPQRSGDDLFLLYTGGTTGQPKGVMWRQDDLFCVLNRSATIKYPEEGGLEAIAEGLTAAGSSRARVIPAAPLMHGTAAFSAFAVLDSGGAVVLCEHTKFDPQELLDTVEAHSVTDLSIVGDAFAKPLLDALEAQPQRWDISSLKVILSSGVMWSAPVKDGLIKHAPNLLCVDTLGSSEAVGLARSISSSRGTAKTAGFKLGPNAQVIREDGTPVASGSGETGLVAVAGRAPIGYFNDPEKSAKTFREIGGRRWTTPGDFATVNEDGTVTLLGRGSGCINTGGEKVFPEEVEEALKLLAGVEDAVVVGAPHHRFGQQVVAFVELSPRAAADVDSLIGQLRTSLAGYKIPRHVSFVESIGRAANGKVDQARWKTEAERFESA